MLDQKIYEHLKQVARNGEIVPYSQIAPMAGLDTGNPAHLNELSDILGAISDTRPKRVLNFYEGLVSPHSRAEIKPTSVCCHDFYEMNTSTITLHLALLAIR